MCQASSLRLRSSPKYLGGLFGHYSHDLYPLWRYLPEAVRENSTRWQEAFGPQASHNPFETMYADPIGLKKFLQTMDALVQLYVPDLLQNYDFSPFHHWMDVGGADLITLSFILHDWDDPECRVILKRCFEALEPGGSLLILEKAFNDERTGPLFPALMNLNRE